jgi:hypothetical protein
MPRNPRRRPIRNRPNQSSPRSAAVAWGPSPEIHRELLAVEEEGEGVEDVRKGGRCRRRGEAWGLLRSACAWGQRPRLRRRTEEAAAA